MPWSLHPGLIAKSSRLRRKSTVSNSALTSYCHAAGSIHPHRVTSWWIWKRKAALRRWGGRRKEKSLTTTEIISWTAEKTAIRWKQETWHNSCYKQTLSKQQELVRIFEMIITMPIFKFKPQLINTMHSNQRW